jgi:hypothetical protein
LFESRVLYYTFIDRIQPLRRQPQSDALSCGGSITSINPASVIVGSPDTVVTITGSGFIAPSLNHQWSFAVLTTATDKPDLLTTYLSDTQLKAIVPAKPLSTARTAKLLVVNGDVMGWSDGFQRYPQSNSVDLVIASQ